MMCKVFTKYIPVNKKYADIQRITLYTFPPSIINVLLPHSTGTYLPMTHKQQGMDANMKHHTLI